MIHGGLGDGLGAASKAVALPQACWTTWQQKSSATMSRRATRKSGRRLADTQGIGHLPTFRMPKTIVPVHSLEIDLAIVWTTCWDLPGGPTSAGRQAVVRIRPTSAGGCIQQPGQNLVVLPAAGIAPNGPAPLTPKITNVWPTDIYRLAELDRLFTFAAYPEVPGTNNASEQLLRGAAQSRKLARTSKSDCGCRRRSVITSVMESLRKHLGTLTMQGAAEAMKQWLTNGHSVFAKQPTEARRLQKLNFCPG